ncbi:hypothetical protein RB195_005451 [Necator americanus]|uniref:Unspecific monooxygenase n=1 Tax=Necator americanus TaxID=51031 RepID=A0ABR1BR49_NECAM
MDTIMSCTKGKRRDTREHLYASDTATRLFMAFIEVLLLIALLLFILCYNINRILGLPPGPTPWPLLGNIPQLSATDTDKCIMGFKKKYGNVFTLWMPYPNVIIGEYEALKRTILRDGDAYAWRPNLFIMQLLVQGNYGLVFEENEWYRSQRRFTLHTLRNLGVGKAVLKDAISTLSHRIADDLRRTNGEPIELKPYLTDVVGNMISQLTFGFLRDDNEIKRIQSLFSEVFDDFFDPKMLLLDVFPFLRHFDGVIGFGLKKLTQDNDLIFDFIRKQYEEHKKAINYDQEPMNYVDGYLHELHRREKDGMQDEFTEKQATAAILDLFGAGVETTTTTLRFCFLYILNYPQIQERIHKEIDGNVGRERDVTMDDQRVLPYTCAFIQEVFRVGYILYTNLPHMTAGMVNCEGYKLRKGTTIIPQFQCVHMDESIYPRPELIIPERHLKDGQFVKDDRITPFGMGRRSCLGESLARMEVFMFFTSLMQKFRFEPDGLYPPEVKCRLSSIRGPVPYKIRAFDRIVAA